jgi:serine-protein kinase ATM
MFEHTHTPQVVHIDFGIVFEQGKTLSTPETVPFRLTRDMVDGLGITGVDGLFKNCCEDTLRCLRRPDNAAALATLAEVTLVHFKSVAL